MIIPKPSAYKIYKHAVVDYVTGKYTKQLENMAIAYTKQFIPRLFRKVLGEYEVLKALDVAQSADEVDMLLHGLRMSYCEDMACWKNSNQFTTEVHFCLVSFFGLNCCFLVFLSCNLHEKQNI